MLRILINLVFAATEHSLHPANRCDLSSYGQNWISSALLTSFHRNHETHLSAAPHSVNTLPLQKAYQEFEMFNLFPSFIECWSMKNKNKNTSLRDANERVLDELGCHSVGGSNDRNLPAVEI